VAVVAVAVAVAGALLFGMQSPMQIRAVQIDGASTDLAPQVAAALAVAPGQSFSSVDTGAAEARIEAIDGIRGANLGWSWWNRLTVDVHEQTPAALVAGPDGAFVVIDAHGVPIRTAAARPAGLPVVQAGSDAERATALAVVAAMPPAVLAAADTVVVHGTADLQVVLANGSTVILGGTDGLAHQLLLAGQLAATNAKQINVSVPDRPALQGVPAPPPAR
jgi:cell division protein FtsQ